MGDVVNLNRARKKKRREAAQSKADTNAIKFGQPKSEREAASAREDLEVRRLDGAKRSPVELEPETNDD